MTIYAFVEFEVFWERFKQELMKGQRIEPSGSTGFWGLTVKKWSMAGNVLNEDVIFLFKGGNEIIFQTGTGKPRVVSKGDFKKIYEVWDDYRRDILGRSDLNRISHNTPWIIPVLKHFEHLMA